MPISPYEVAAFVDSCNVVDEAIVYIDSILSTPEEKLYRYGDYDGTCPHDYYYDISLPPELKLDLAQVEDLRTVYNDVGWPAVQVIRNPVGRDRVRLFMNKNSKYFGA